MMMALSFQTLSTVESFQNKRVLVRVDFNVPQDETGRITDDTRLVETLPTLRFLLEKGAKLVLISHWGRPKGQVVESMRLTSVAEALRGLLPGVTVHKANDVVGPDAQAKVAALKAGEVLLLENVRFEAGEEKNDPALSEALAQLTDIYVNDAFGAAHRAHASTEGITRFVKVSAAGLLMQKELDALGGILNAPKRPFMALIGGSKISTKIEVLTSLLDKVDTLVVFGGMAYTFLLAKGFSVGKSICEPDFVDTAKAILEKAQTKGVRLLLSEDVVVADAFSAEAKTQTVAANQIPDGWEGVDIGPKTRALLNTAILESKSLVWNGPAGVFELAPFAAGTRAVAEAVQKATQKGCQTVLGGGDTVAAIEAFQLPKESFTHVSTGGGASLEFLEGKTLPGVAALLKAPVGSTH
jgi:phosphoglycerate kinase